MAVISNPSQAQSAQPSQPPSLDARPVVHFRNDYFLHTLSTHSPTPVVHNFVMYPTPEHMFQATKFRHRPDIIKKILRWPHPRHATKVAKKYSKDVHHLWKQESVEMLEAALREKYIQHLFLLNQLLTTGNADLELISADTVWGMGWNREGSNLFGKTLMNLRTKFINEIQTYHRIFPPSRIVLPRLARGPRIPKPGETCCVVM